MLYIVSYTLVITLFNVYINKLLKKLKKEKRETYVVSLDYYAF